MHYAEFAEDEVNMAEFCLICDADCLSESSPVERYQGV